MVTLVIWSILLGLIPTTIAVRLGARHTQRTLAAAISISMLMLIATAGLAAWPTYPIAHKLAKSAAISGYQQYLNGTVKNTHVQAIPCRKNGRCEHTYDCDSYEVPHTTTDDKGKTTTTYTTEWNSCPYMTHEYIYTIEIDAKFKVFTKTLGDYIFAADPELAPVHWDKRFYEVPKPDEVPRGIPRAWQQARDGKARGDAVPATILDPDGYDNYILANEDNLYREHSDDIDRLRKAGLLPMLPLAQEQPVRDFYVAHKALFVGFQPSKQAFNAWQSLLMRMNAYGGSQKQGDLFIVAAPASKIHAAGLSEFNFTQAIKADWLNSHGKKAFPKNGIALILAISDDHKTIQWSRAFTGMPKGNEGMLNRLSEFGDNPDNLLPFDPAAVLGVTKARVVGNAVQYFVPQAIVPNIMLRGAYTFARACMKCKDKGEKGKGYVDLSDEIAISTAGKVLGTLGLSITMGIFWILLLMYLTDRFNPSRGVQSYPTNRLYGNRYRSSF